MTAAEKQAFHIRWMTAKDVDEVLQIEYNSFEDHWTDEEFKKHLAKKPCVSMLAYRRSGYHDQVVGYFVYRMSKTGFELLKIAVHPDFRRQGVGRQMVEKLVDKLRGSYRVRVETVVRDRDVGTQIFFRGMGWKAEKAFRSHFPADDDLKLAADDGILFAYNVPPDDVGLKS